MAARTREFGRAEEREESTRLLIRDRDTKFEAAFDEALDDHGMAPVPLPHCASNLNAYAERLIQSVQDECLNKLVVLGTRHLDYLVSEYVEHYNTERPHSGIGFRAPAGGAPPLPRNRPIRCRTRLGGVLPHYTRAAELSLLLGHRGVARVIPNPGALHSGKRQRDLRLLPFGGAPRENVISELRQIVA